MMSDQTGLALQGNGQAMQTFETMSRPLRRQTMREIEQVRGRAIVVSVHEEERATLTHQAMTNAAILGMAEENLVRLAPLAASTLQALTTAYGIGAAKIIMSW